MKVNAQRDQRWDTIRGIAVLGILPVNLWVFGWPVGALYQPELALTEALWDRLAWGLVTLIFEHSMVLTLAFLMGMGLGVMAQHGRGSVIIIKRLSVLAALGIMHAYLFWWGDILWLLAICGVLAWLSRELSRISLLRIGLTGLVVPSTLLMLWSLSATTTFSEAFNPVAVNQIEQTLATYRASWILQFQQRWPLALWMQTFGVLTYGVWHLLGAMLLGMAASRVDWQHRQIKAQWIMALLILSFALKLIIIYNQWQGTGYSLGVAAMLLPIAGGIQSAAYVLLFVTYWPNLQPTQQHWLGKVMGATGRLSLSIYLLQSMVLSLIFYGHGLGLMGQLSLWQLALLGLSLIALLATLAYQWEQRIGAGPAERLWRTLSYR